MTALSPSVILENASIQRPTSRASSACVGSESGFAAVPRCAIFRCSASTADPGWCILVALLHLKPSGHGTLWGLRLTFPFNSGNSFQVNAGFQNSKTSFRTYPRSSENWPVFQFRKALPDGFCVQTGFVLSNSSQENPVREVGDELRRKYGIVVFKRIVHFVDENQVCV